MTEISSPTMAQTDYLPRVRIEKSINRNELVRGPIEIKYPKNFAKDEINQIRVLLSREREIQSQEEFEFWTTDYERMLQDDWLVSRFLIRGLKASQRYGKLKEDLKSRDRLIKSTLILIKACAKLRFDFRINSLTDLKEFPMEWVKVNGLFNHKFDVLGNPTIYLRIKSHKPRLIGTKALRHQFKRYLLYTLEKSDQELMNRPGKLLCCIFDMSQATLENVDLELVSWMIKSFKICGPKLVSYVIVYNLPWFFSATFKIISSTLLSNNNKQSLKFVYGREILNYIVYDNLPEYMKNEIAVF